VWKFTLNGLLKIVGKCRFNKITLNGKLEIVGGKKLWKTSIVIL
jgi:hypothetical protein